MTNSIEPKAFLNELSITELLAGYDRDFILLGANIEIDTFYGPQIIPDFWAIGAVIDDRFYNIYLGIEGFSTSGSDVTGGDLIFLGITSDDGPIDDSDDEEPTHIAVSGFNIELSAIIPTTNLDGLQVDDNALLELITSAPNDTTLSSLNDIILAGNGDDYVFGDYGNDTLDGGTGNDTLDGGAGEDTAIFSGDFNDAEIYIDGDTIFVETTLGGIDQLTSVEHLQFSDRTVGVNLDGLNGTSYDPSTEIYAYRINGINIPGEDNDEGDWVLQSAPSEAVTIVYGSSDLELSFIQDRTYGEYYSHVMSVSNGELYDLQINGMSVGDPRIDIDWTALETVQLGVDQDPVQIFSVDGILSLYENWSWGSKEFSNILYVDETPLFDSVPTEEELQNIVAQVDGGAPGYHVEAADNTVIRMSDVAEGVRISDIPNLSEEVTTEYDVEYDGDIVELSFSGFSLVQTWTDANGSDEILGPPSEATLIIRGSEDLEIYAEAFFGENYEVDPDDYDQELRIVSGEIYEIELNGEPLAQEDGGELYTFIQNVVSPRFGTSVVFGMELASGDVSQTNVFYLSGDRFGSNGIPSLTELEGLIGEVETGTGSFAPIVDGPFQFTDFDHVRSAVVDTIDNTDTTPPSVPIITSIAGGDGTLTQDELSDWSISGTAEAYSTVSIALDGDPMGAVTTTAAADGTWEFTGADLEITSIGDLPPGGDGDYGFTVTATDEAGNTSEEAAGTITLDVEQEVAGVGMRFAGAIADMAPHVQARTGSQVSAIAQSLRNSVEDVDDDYEETDSRPDVETLLAAVSELQSVDLTTAISQIGVGGEQTLRATEANTAVALEFGLDTDNLEKTILVNDYATVIVNGAAKIRGGEGANTFVGDSASQDVMMGDDDDNLNGGGGNDTVGSAGGNDTISGGSGNDIAFGGLGNDSVGGGSGDDYVLDSWGSDNLSGGSGHDIIRSFDGGDTIFAGGGTDTVYGGRGDDSIDGGDDNDVLYGDTVLFASRGDDTLEGGAGNDILQGGFGADTFVFNANLDGDDIIGRVGGGADFESGIDHVQLVGFSATTTDDVMAYVSDESGTAVFAAEGITITFDSLVKADLTADDFIF